MKLRVSKWSLELHFQGGCPVSSGYKYHTILSMLHIHPPTSPLQTSLPHLYHTSTTPLPHLYHTSATLLLQLYYISTTSLLHLYYISTTSLLHLYHTSTAPLLHLCHTSTTPLPLLSSTSSLNLLTFIQQWKLARGVGLHISACFSTLLEQKNVKRNMAMLNLKHWKQHQNNAIKEHTMTKTKLQSMQSKSNMMLNIEKKSK